jgi:phosphoenolpyruvate-protein kinase (PTS system EI component)
MSFANLNLSIRWKMLAGFLISAVLPCILIYNEVPLKWTALISISVSLTLALIGIVRIMKILNKIQSALGEKDLSCQEEKDELRLIDESLDHFTDYFSKTKIVFDGADMDQTSGIEVASVEKSYKAGLVTGEPAAGEIYVLPNSTTTELVTSARLVGELAQQVFDKAVLTVTEDLNNLKTLGGLTESDQGIIDFQVIILHDPSLIMEVEQSLKSGENLLATLSRTFEAFIDKLKNSNNIYMKGRIYDFNDLRQRLFDAIHKATGQETGDRFSGAKGKIAVCRHVLPSEVISLHNAGAVGIISRENTPSSHAQILLSSLNMPSASSIENLPVSKLTGHSALINILKGTINIDPSEKRVKSTIEEFVNRKAEIIDGPVTLKSGESINIGVTVNNPRIEAVHAKEVSPDFVGLFRTEMHFIGKKSLPT